MAVAGAGSISCTCELLLASCFICPPSADKIGGFPISSLAQGVRSGGAGVNSVLGLGFAVPWNRKSKDLIRERRRQEEEALRRAVKGCGVQSGSGQHPAERETERKGPHGQGAGQVRTFQYKHVPPKAQS